MVIFGVKFWRKSKLTPGDSAVFVLRNCDHDETKNESLFERIKIANLKRNPKKEEKTRKAKKYSKWAFQLSVFFQGGCPKFPFLTTWPKKTRTPTHYKNRGFSKLLFGGKNTCVTKRPFLDQKNPNPEIPVIIFCLFSSQPSTKNTKNRWNPLLL